MVSTRSSTRNTRSKTTSTSPPITTSTTRSRKKRTPAPTTSTKKKKRKLQTPPPTSPTAAAGGEGGSAPSSPSAQQLHSETEEDAGRKARAREAGVLEKGIIYFFFRNKVSVERAGGLEDVKRGYVVLKPMGLGEGVGENGEKKVEGRCRFLAMPKKRLPTRGHEKFLTFVEEPSITVQELKDRFLKSSSYMTRTQGERTDAAAEPIGEGVYALVKHPKERSSHLAYHLTIPEHASELQSEFGIKDHGSFVVSVKNPTAPAPQWAVIADPAEFSKEIMEEFGGLRWSPLGKEHLEYKNAQILFIGEREVLGGKEHEVASEELEELEEEDMKRVEHLKGDEAVFRDLELDRGEYVGVKSSW
ncbi:hypothetical protein L873DRAFT_1686121 [Choiromyces venosus 120613-1]|uniref:Uncharacterized protein n=1 Tax=Choiromyces venosus 120613-1 TaxID=1336337 RepID=A0A3N4JPR9_9PEZI|nr:hypothetical protein L873DRAFT_1686121 [Choiromyces venosus 120613-1]